MGEFAKPEDPSIIREYRITLPLSVAEYKIGQLYSTCEAMKEETGGGEGFEVVTNEAADNGQYSHKIIHLASKVPNFIQMLAPKGSLEIHELSLNSYPNLATKYSNPDYMKDNFALHIESQHVDGASDEENIFQLSDDELSKRVVDRIDIVNDQCDPRDYKENEDPSKYSSVQLKRGPFTGNDWKTQNEPMMTIYKLYRITFKWHGLQARVESMIVKSVRRILFNFQRKVVCGMDKWNGMTIDQIRELEDKVKNELNTMRVTGEVKGMAEK